MTYFERELYSELVDWVARFPKHAAFLEGPRQVGKTEMLLKLGREYFENCVYIDLRAEGVADRFDELTLHYTGLYKSKPAEESGPMWERIFNELGEGYTNEATTLVILDEIQESVAAYNAIRRIRRSLKSRLAVSGSYLGITKPELGYRESTGDFLSYELSSMSFREFLKANGIWDEYDKVNTSNWALMSEAEQSICERVRELYRVYCQIGGYPDVVSAWINYGDVAPCLKMTADLLIRLYRESSSYFGEVVGGALWSRTMERVAAHMVTKSGDLDIAIANEIFRSDNSKGLEIRRKDKINALKWLDDCRIVGTVQVYDKLERVAAPGNKLLFYFRDMGLMTQLCKETDAILPSDFSGMAAENFVYLYLRDSTNPVAGRNVYSYSGNAEQIDFITRSENLGRIGIEVKHGNGSTKSGDKALADGRIDYLIRVQDTYGSVGEKQATIPIFMLDKLKLLLEDELNKQ